MEFTFERKETEADRNTTEEDESTLSKLGSKISSFFSSRSGSSEDENNNNTTNTTTEEVPTGNNTETNAKEQETKPIDEKEVTNSTENTNTTTTTTETTTTTKPPPKMITIREPLQFQVESRDYADPTPEAQANSQKKLNALDEHDRQALALATAKNNLESFIYDMRDKLENDAIYKKAVTTDDHTQISDKLTEVDAWLWDDGITADVKTLKSKLDELKTLTKGLKLRVREVDLRPQKLKELKEALNATEHFVTATRVLFLKKEDDEKPFTDAEINALEKIVKETYTWRDEVVSAFAKLLPTETPKYLSTDFDDKINLLKRETNYLLGKAQRFVPKPKTTTTTPKVPVQNDTKAAEQEETSTTTPVPEQSETESEETTTTTTAAPTTEEERTDL